MKIDKIFVKHMHANHADLVMVEKIIEMGHELDMEVIAEGVEPKNNSRSFAKKAATAFRVFCLVARFRRRISCAGLKPIAPTKYSNSVAIQRDH